MASTAALPAPGPRVLDAVLTDRIRDREPGRTLARGCAETEPRELPVLPTDVGGVTLWTKVALPAGGQVQHSYYGRRLGERVSETWKPAFDGVPRVLTRVDAGDGWQRVATVVLGVPAPTPWRTWSSKGLVRGDWRIEVRSRLRSGEMRTLCVLYFRAGTRVGTGADP